jgi:curli biogenesis system outer membrane secretion channel CsgG
MRRIHFLILYFPLCACATTAPPAEVSVPSVLQTNDVTPSHPVLVLKRKIAVGRFTNETLYGKALLEPDSPDPLAGQAEDMVATALGNTHKFVVLDRQDLGLVEAEKALTGSSNKIVGADDLLVGAVTQFGRQTEGEDGFLSNTKKQIAYAQVQLRLIDAKTARVVFTATGTGQALVEHGTVAGFGNQAAYDETLNDRAINAAINDVMNELVEKLDSTPWHTDILKVDGASIYIAGGTHQGVTPGMNLALMQPGQAVQSATSGFDIDLPAQQVATLKVVSTFGENAENEGSICEVTSGRVPPHIADLVVVAGTAP